MTQAKPHATGELGWWRTEHQPIPLNIDSIKEHLFHINQPVIIVETGSGPGLVQGPGERIFSNINDASKGVFPVISYAHSSRLQSLGDRSFQDDWNLRYPMVGGSMANGISSVNLVTTLAKSGMMGFYGAAGQHLSVIENAIEALKKQCGSSPWGINLIHSPQEPLLEEHLVDLLIHTGTAQIEASAYMTMTRALVRYRLHGIHRNDAGTVVTPHQILAKASRIEIARKFFSPPPESIVQSLVTEGILTETEAVLAREIPMAHDLTAEADSGGHTDNRPLVTLLPSFQAVARDCQEQFSYKKALRVGTGGGISTPASAAAAFVMGAGWVVVGSIAQAAVESGTSDIVRRMLAEVEQAEIAMAPAADMFEMGINLQVLKRGDAVSHARQKTL